MPSTSVTVITFLGKRAPEILPNDPRMEWLFICLDGHPNPAKKRIIVLAASAEVGFLTHEQATVLISALGLEDA